MGWRYHTVFCLGAVYANFAETQWHHLLAKCKPLGGLLQGGVPRDGSCKMLLSQFTTKS